MRTTARRYVGRLVVALTVLIAVFALTFAVMRMAPGGPFDRMDRLSPEVLANLEARYGLDQPLPVQFFQLLGGYVVGDFGPSLTFAPGRTVGEVLKTTMPVSLELGFYALIVALFLGIGLGVLAGRRPGGWLDRCTSGLSLVIISASIIVLATLVRTLLITPDGPFVLGGFDSWRNKLLPSLTLGIAYAAILTRLVRANVATQVAANVGRGAKARGVTPRRVFIRYVVPAALIPMLSYMGAVVAAMLTGSFVVETIFAIPGAAALFVEGAQARDYPVVMAAIMVYTTLLVTLNLLCEWLQTFLDPRLRAAASREGES
jgi:oligopeptide transport system permease protein